MKGVGRAPPPSTAWPNFTLMTEHMAECRYYSVEEGSRQESNPPPHPPPPRPPQYSLPRGGHCSPGNSLNSLLHLQSICSKESSMGVGGGRETNKSWLYLFWPTSLVL